MECQDVSSACIGQESAICISCNRPSVLYFVIACSTCENIGDSYGHDINNRDILGKLNVAQILRLELYSSVVHTYHAAKRTLLIWYEFIFERCVFVDTDNECFIILVGEIDIYAACSTIPCVAYCTLRRSQTINLYILSLVVLEVCNCYLNRINLYALCYNLCRSTGNELQ